MPSGQPLRPPAGESQAPTVPSTVRRPNRPVSSPAQAGGRSGRNAPSAVPNARRVGRYVPADSLFQALEDAAPNNAPPAKFRAIAMRDIQRARVAASEKYKLFIPCGAIAGSSQLDEIMLSIHMEDQTALWKDSLPTLCDFIRIPSKGVRFTCTARDAAVKLGGTTVRIFGGTHIVKKFSLYEWLYTLNLTRIPSDLDDDHIFNFFASRGLHVLITPTHQVGSMISRDRTIWCTTEDCPAALLLPDGTAIREIFFDGFADPVFIQHKQRSLNTKPPSLGRREANEARRAAETAQRSLDRDHRSTSASLSPPPTDLAVSAAPVPTDDDVRLDLLKPEPTASLLAWSSVTRPIICTKPASRPTPIAVDCTATLLEDGRMVFGIPAPPTDFELAFADDCDDVDVDVFLGESAAVAPIEPSLAVGQLISARSLLQVHRTQMKRSRFKSLAADAQADFLTSVDPESRLASITAQPLVISRTLHEITTATTRILEEHAVLRAYSAFPASTHTSSRQFAPRIKIDFPDNSTNAAGILAHIYPSRPARDLAQAYASVDLFFRTHAALIYNDPFKVAAVTGVRTPDCLPFSEFLLWSDDVLHALCSTEIPEAFSGGLPPHVEASILLIRSPSDDDMASDEGSHSDAIHAL
ncbi:hypothetical protein CCR75_001704 [Bremia lactucae]|uniref:Uncharacterized protein n=1 Tax=Bremia lactucae TaxID=4779 RepID=A0A976FGQ0_BRELC|nr:hypothetical protein CCR75_001704 [Bremia lactucae]